MSKEMVISANPHETRVALLEEGQLCEYYVEREKEFALVGSIYKGRVTRVLPGMQSAFVEIGLDSDAFLYVTDFLDTVADFDDHVAVPAASKGSKVEDQGSRTFSESPNPASTTAASALEPLEGESIRGSVSSSTHGGEQTGDDFHDDVAPPASGSDSALKLPGSFRAPGQRSSTDSNQGSGRPPRPFGSRGRQGGRDFRGGGGSRGGRSGGRFNRRGGRPSGGGGRFGRDLPQSKYASPRPYEDSSSEAAPPPDGSIPVILPGESLAKYKEKPPVPSGAAAEQSAQATPESASEQSPWLAPAQTSESASERAPEVHQSSAEFAGESLSSPSPQPFAAPPARSFGHSRPSASSTPSGSGGLEPLPGESLAKWRTAEPAKEERFPAPPEIKAAPTVERTESVEREEIEHEDDKHNRAASAEDHDANDNQYADHAVEDGIGNRDVSQGDTGQGANGIDGLSDEEAQLIAEHVAEAQSDIAERDGDHQIFSPVTGNEMGEESREDHISAQEETELQSEQRDLEEEEADAEAEGMIAPPSDGDAEIEHGNALAADTASPAGESSSDDAAAFEGQRAR